MQGFCHRKQELWLNNDKFKIFWDRYKMFLLWDHDTGCLEGWHTSGRCMSSSSLSSVGDLSDDTCGYCCSAVHQFDSASVWQLLDWWLSWGRCWRVGRRLLYCLLRQRRPLKVMCDVKQRVRKGAMLQAFCLCLYVLAFGLLFWLSFCLAFYQHDVSQSATTYIWVYSIRLKTVWTGLKMFNMSLNLSHRWAMHWYIQGKESADGLDPFPYILEWGLDEYALLTVFPARKCLFSRPQSQFTFVGFQKLQLEWLSSWCIDGSTV